MGFRIREAQNENSGVKVCKAAQMSHSDFGLRRRGSRHMILCRDNLTEILVEMSVHDAPLSAAGMGLTHGSRKNTEGVL